MQVRCASNGKLGLEMVKQQVPQLILCDLVMPEMDGVEFLHLLSEFDSSIPIAILSAAQTQIIDSVIDMAREFKFESVSKVSKPTNVASLSNLIKKTEMTKSKVGLPNKGFEPTDSDIAWAIENRLIRPYFQPQVDLVTGQNRGFEVLARWEHPELGCLAPIHFISKLYSRGFGYNLFQSVLKQSLEFVQSHKQTCPNLSISVNVSPSDLLQPKFVEQVLSWLDHYEVAPAQLTIELTETEIRNDVGQMLRVATRLRLNDVQLSIDDFGTGYSSLVDLIAGPFSELKIDRSFINQMLESDKYRAGVQNVVDLARRLNIELVAEGVETHDQLDYLRNFGAMKIQGFYFSRPMPLDAASAYLIATETLDDVAN
jgi:EAL domain-containing protein (putative c-di-GMP-specific phosphodiesterase class I)